jgi:hypothetical protein
MHPVEAVPSVEEKKNAPALAARDTVDPRRIIAVNGSFFSPPPPPPTSNPGFIQRFPK